MANDSYYGVIMAGGVGSRFWPVSTREFPKQFHDMLGTGSSLLQTTFSRLTAFIPPKNILILTNALYTDIILEQLPEIGADQLVLEPVMRNTAPCILLAALKIRKEHPGATMLVAPSDHWITDEEAFINDVNFCFEACAEKDILCTLGITPTFPNTGFGYIEYRKTGNGENSDHVLQPVVQFREKPDYQTAKSFLEQGNFLWNAGIFMWSVASIIKAFKNLQPEMYRLFFSNTEILNTEAEAQFLEESYGKAQNISIDYAILEGSDNVYVLPAAFDWNDLGTWGALHEKMREEENDNVLVNGQMWQEDTRGNMIRLPRGKSLVVKGIKDYIIVDHDDTLLLIPREDEQEIKRIAAAVQEMKKEKP